MQKIHFYKKDLDGLIGFTFNLLTLIFILAMIDYKSRKI